MSENSSQLAEVILKLTNLWRKALWQNVLPQGARQNSRRNSGENLTKQKSLKLYIYTKSMASGWVSWWCDIPTYVYWHLNHTYLYVLDPVVILRRLFGLIFVWGGYWGAINQVILVDAPGAPVVAPHLQKRWWADPCVAWHIQQRRSRKTIWSICSSICSEAICIYFLVYPNLPFHDLPSIY